MIRTQLPGLEVEWHFAVPLHSATSLRYCLSYCNLYALPLALTNFLGSENISMNRCLSSKKMEGTRPTAQEDQRPCRRKLPSLSALGVHTEEAVKQFQSDRYAHLGISMPEDVAHVVVFLILPLYVLRFK